MPQQDTATVRAPAESERTGANVPGTVGYDIYLASIGGTPDALRTPRLPSFGNKYKGMGHAF